MSRAARTLLLLVLLIGSLAWLAPGAGALVPAESDALPPHDPHRVLVAFQPEAQPADVAAAHAAVGARVESRIGSTGVVTVALPRHLAPAAAAATYRRMRGVAFAEPNWLIRLAGAPSDSRLGEQWALNSATGPDIDAYHGWAAAYGAGRFPATGGVRVGVVDSGIDRTHPELMSKVVGCGTANSGTGIVLPGSCSDDHGHGTHVGGIIAAATDNATGVAGVAPDAQLAVVKALNGIGEGFYSDVIASLRWLRVEAGVRVINMSFGGGPRSDAFDRELSAAAAAGVLLVAASGNNGSSTLSYPASHRDVLSVGAVDMGGARAGFSNCNDDVEIAAPGVNILSTGLAGGYLYASGTSMAAPHVAGAGAVLMSTRGMTAAAARSALVGGTVGSGGCLAVGTLNLATALGAPAPVVTASPTPAATPPPPPVSPSAEASASPAATEISTPSPTANATLSQAPAPAPSPEPTATPEPSPTPSPAVTPAPSPIPSPTPTPTPAAVSPTASASSPPPSASPSDGPGPTPAPEPSRQGAAPATPTGGYVPVAPQRLVDSRTGLGSPPTRLVGGETRTFAVAGQAGIPSDGVRAVVVNVTAVAPSHSTYLTAFPAAQARPTASTLNTGPGRTTATLATVQLSNDGRLAVFNQAGSVDVVLDVVGFYGDGTLAEEQGFEALAPSRLLDTRTDGGPVAPGGPRPLQVAGRAGVPGTGVRAAVLNVTVTAPTRASHLTAYADGSAPPATSSLNFAAGETRANLVVVALDASGRIALANHAGGAHVVVDVLGWFGEGAVGRFGALPPTRLHDTRQSSSGGVPGGSSITVAAAERAGVPADATAVLVTVTATGATSPAHVSLHVAGEAPRASTLNLRPGSTVANLAVVPTTPEGAVGVYNSAGTTHVVLDVVGFYRT
ncbi:MAG TPA: S8 family serine peptidase [Mycobacteriales bacterium]|nr:S8 family serine peptidase [Mycobacteriales bacterium]